MLNWLVKHMSILLEPPLRQFIY